jgi:excisionase family DNA binding protein
MVVATSDRQAAVTVCNQAREGQSVKKIFLADDERLLTPAEVAAMFRVDPKTVTRWAKDGRLTSKRTLGGHRRYLEMEIRALLEGEPTARMAS